MNKIEFYFSGNKVVQADIFEDRRTRHVKSEDNINKLIEICNKYGQSVSRENDTIVLGRKIIKKYNDWYYSKKRYALCVMNNVKNEMKLNRRFVSAGKRITAMSLAAIITVGGISLLNKKNDNKDAIANTQTQTQSNNTTSKKQIESSSKIIETKHGKYKIKEETKKKKVEKKHIHSNKQELNSMLEKESFDYSYEDRSNNPNIENARRYEDTFKKYADMYGLDKDLLMAIAAQESSGDHYNNLNSNQPGKGIMQIEYVHIGETLSAHNYETNTEDSIKVDMNTLSDLDSNIKVGAMILRNCIDNYNCNIPLSLQTYNFGPGNINKVLNACSSDKGVDINSLKDDPTNNAWLNYRSFLGIGDPEYVEHVFSYLNTKAIKVLDKDGNQVTINLNNELKNSKQR